MIKSKRKLLALGLALGLILVLALFHFSGARDPHLTVTYLTRTNNNAGQSIGLFAITNVGNAPAVNYKLGSVEVFGKAPPVQVPIRYERHRLLPGEGDVVQVFLPPGVQGRWRFTAEYAHE